MQHNWPMGHSMAGRANGIEKAMKAGGRQARLEHSVGSTPDLLNPPQQTPPALPECGYTRLQNPHVNSPSHFYASTTETAV